MAILKVDDMVLVQALSEDEVDWFGRITQLNFHPNTHLVWRLDGQMAMALLRHERNLTLIDPAFHNLLTSVHKEVSDD